MTRILRLSHLTPSEGLLSIIVILIGALAVISLGIWIVVR